MFFSTENGGGPQASPNMALVSQNSTNSNSSSMSSEIEDKQLEGVQLAGDSLEDMLNHMGDYAPTVSKESVIMMHGTAPTL